MLYMNAKRSLDVSVLECSIPLEDRQVVVDTKAHDSITAGLRALSELSLEPAPKMDSQICVLDLENQAPVIMLFHPYQPLLVVADAACSVTLWMPERGIMRCEFSNCSPTRASICAMALTSASSSTGGHLLVATDDGYVRVWGDLFSVKSNKVRLASSFLALPGCKGKGWSPDTKALEYCQLTWCAGSVTTAMTCFQNTSLAVAGGSCGLSMWDLVEEKRSCYHEAPTPTSRVTAICQVNLALALLA